MSAAAFQEVRGAIRPETRIPQGCRVPVFLLTSPTLGHFVIEFTPEEEDRTAYKHYRDTCGWTPAQLARLPKRAAWFSACVSLRRFGEPLALAETYLGACHYRTEGEFVTTYFDDYFIDKVLEVVTDACRLHNLPPELLGHVQAMHRAARQPVKEPAA